MTRRRAALLREDEHLAVGVVEEAVGHGGVGGVEVDADAVLRGGVAVAAEGDDAFDEVGGRGWEWERVPAHLVGRRGLFVEGAAAQEGGFGEWLVGLVDDRGADAVHPGAAVEAARGGEGGAAYLLGVEAEGMLLRGVLADGESAGVGLGGELVSKS